MPGGGGVLACSNISNSAIPHGNGTVIKGFQARPNGRYGRKNKFPFGNYTLNIIFALSI
jgi:hypothetical protein